MIVSDNAPPSPLKGTSPNFPQSTEVVQDPPPSYGTAQSQIPSSQRSPLLQQSQSQSYSSAGPSRLPPPASSLHRNQSPAKRFFKAFAVAVLIWALFWIFIGTTISVRVSKRERTSYKIPKDIHLHDCVEGPDMEESHLPRFFASQQNMTKAEQDGWPFEFSWMHKSFELPLSSKNLFLVSREEHSGYPGGRTVKIVSSPDLRDDVIKVDVSIMHQDVDWLAGVKTCLVSRKKEENGVGVFVLPYQSSNRQSWYLQIDILVTVPEVGWDPVRIKSFETDLPLYTHALGSLTDFVEFDKLSLKSSNAAIQAQSLKVHDQCTIHTSNGPVKIESLVASNARVETSNGPITGHYDATGSLGLYSSDGYIDATINLTSSDQKGELFMKTSNGLVRADVNLIPGDSSRASEDTFTAAAITSNGLMTFNLLSLPFESTLELETKTSNSNAKVTLPQTFEGQFTLSTSNAAPEVSRYPVRERDPAGQGRQRQLNTKSKLKHFWQGNVYWDKDHDNLSNAKVRTSNGKVLLVL